MVTSYARAARLVIIEDFFSFENIKGDGLVKPDLPKCRFSMYHFESYVWDYCFIITSILFIIECLRFFFSIYPINIVY